MIDPTITQDVAALVEDLQQGWNAGDGAAFSARFADDADFVNVYGMLARGRESIIAGHEHIFHGVYAGSRVAYRVESARLLAPGVLLVHLHARLSVPQGPMAGEHQARPSLVLTRAGDDWQIASFHNTFIREPGPPRS